MNVYEEWRPKVIQWDGIDNPQPFVNFTPPLSVVSEPSFPKSNKPQTTPFA
jgi:hypothetical protein